MQCYRLDWCRWLCALLLRLLHFNWLNLDRIGTWATLFLRSLRLRWSSLTYIKSNVFCLAFHCSSDWRPFLWTTLSWLLFTFSWWQLLYRRLLFIDWCLWEARNSDITNLRWYGGLSVALFNCFHLVSSDWSNLIWTLLAIVAEVLHNFLFISVLSSDYHLIMLLESTSDRCPSVSHWRMWVLGAKPVGSLEDHTVCLRVEV